MLRWLGEHPEVSAVFVSQITGSAWTATGGRSEFETAVAGFSRAWRAVPRSVRRIVVIRDTPRSETAAHACIERAIDRHRRAGRGVRAAAALRRAGRSGGGGGRPHALLARAGPSTSTASSATTGSATRSSAAALVYKDQHHLTAVFATTLGPYLLRAVDRALRTGTRP